MVSFHYFLMLMFFVWILCFLVCFYSITDQRVEFIGIPCGASGEEPVDGRLHNQVAGIVRIYASAVENRNLFAGVAEQFVECFFDYLMHFFGIVRGSRGSVDTDGPDWFIGYPDLSDLIFGYSVESDL